VNRVSPRIRLGLSSRSAIVSSPVMLALPCEGADAFKNRRDEVQAGLSPVEPKEELRVERILNPMRRLRRSARAKTVLVTGGCTGASRSGSKSAAASHETPAVDTSSL
jgi:hypothetical protein